MAFGHNDDLSALDLNRVQSLFVPQIERSAASMHHIDELFQWLANAFVRYFNIQLLTIWANRVNQFGQLVAQLRTIGRQDATFPEQIIVNDQIQRLAEQLITRRLSCKPQPLETLFSPYQTMLLKRYGLHYWAACFISKNALLPVRGNILASEEAPVFLAMITLCFFRQLPPADIVQPISFVVDKATDTALTRGLLLPPQEQQTPFPPPPPITPLPFQEPQPPVQEQRLLLTQLIPEQKQDANLMLSDNPFTRAVAIADKKARRLHAAIDGQTNVARLCSVTGMSMSEVTIALRLLWEQERIEVRGPAGQTVDLLPFLNNL